MRPAVETDGSCCSGLQAGRQSERAYTEAQCLDMIHEITQVHAGPPAEPAMVGSGGVERTEMGMVRQGESTDSLSLLDFAMLIDAGENTVRQQGRRGRAGRSLGE